MHAATDSTIVMPVCLLFVTDVDGHLMRMPLVTDASITPRELVSPPLSKDYKHCLAVAAIDAIQLAVVGPANGTDSSMLQIVFCPICSLVTWAYLPVTN